MSDQGRRWLRRHALDVVTACAVVAAGITGTVAARRLSVGSSGPAAQPVANWRELVQAGTRLGAPDAEIRIVEFGDYQCPSCRRAAIALDSALTRIPGAALSYIHFPLTAIHPAAFDAAAAAECAAEQGRFREMHLLLFRKSAETQAGIWRALAAEAGVDDLDGFDTCLESDAVRQRVNRHAALAGKLGVVGTPAFVLDGHLLPIGAPVERVLERLQLHAGEWR